jgi:hypothetical protein
VLGDVPLRRLTVDLLDRFYVELRQHDHRCQRCARLVREGKPPLCAALRVRCGARRPRAGAAGCGHATLPPARQARRRADQPARVSPLLRYAVARRRRGPSYLRRPPRAWWRRATTLRVYGSSWQLLTTRQRRCAPSAITHRAAAHSKAVWPVVVANAVRACFRPSAGSCWPPCSAA